MKEFRLFIFLCFGLLSFSQNATLFDEGNTLYNKGDYAQAIDKYETILQSEEHSAELYFNLANAHYKLSNTAPAIYYYEKALLLKPNDKEILNNLSFAQNMTIDAIDKVPEVGFSRLFKNLISLTSSDTWSIISIVGIVIFVVLFLLYHFARATTQKRIAFIVSLLSLFLGVFSLFMAFQKVQLDKKNNPAIVFVQETRVKSDPNKTSEELFRLHEGTKVQILDSYNEWYKIEIADKTTGWLPKESLKAIK